MNSENVWLKQTEGVLPGKGKHLVKEAGSLAGLRVRKSASAARNSGGAEAGSSHPQAQRAQTRRAEGAGRASAELHRRPSGKKGPWRLHFHQLKTGGYFYCL